jgi:hypothetical protein
MAVQWMWAGAAGMVVYAVYRWFRDERGQDIRRPIMNIKTGLTALLMAPAGERRGA